jgi:N-acetylneuraminate synthase
MVKAVRIAGRQIGPGQPCFIIAEAGVNHNGDIKLAHQLIDAAVEAGADAVKFQNFVTEELITPEAPKAAYQVVTTGQPGSQYGMLKALELAPGGQAELKAHCEASGIVYLCTPYDRTSVDMLEAMDVEAFKVASTDTTNIPFLREIASKGRPVILSTGMSTFGEVEQSVQTLWRGGLEGNVIILHCTSEYPAPLQETNLRAIPALQQAFGCPVGFSDHTEGVQAGAWAVAMGACVIEKHFTLDRTLTGPDHRASLDPAGFADLVRAVGEVESALGDGIKRPMPSELPNKPLMQKSLVAKRAFRSGETIDAEGLTCKRPGFGLDPSWFDRVVGKRAAADIPKDSVLTLASVDWEE